MTRYLTSCGRLNFGNGSKRVRELGCLLPSCRVRCDSLDGLAREKERSYGGDLVAAAADVISYRAVLVPAMSETAKDLLPEISQVTVY